MQPNIIYDSQTFDGNAVEGLDEEPAMEADKCNQRIASRIPHEVTPQCRRDRLLTSTNTA